MNIQLTNAFGYTSHVQKMSLTNARFHIYRMLADNARHAHITSYLMLWTAHMTARNW